MLVLSINKIYIFTLIILVLIFLLVWALG